PQVELYASIGSTSDRAKKLAENGVASGALVLADEQSAGRGLRARRWYSPRGSGLYLSLVLRPTGVANPLLVPLLAGLGIAQAVERLIGLPRVALKWPNDVILDDRKVGGVLSEASWTGQSLEYFVLGIGLNVHQSREDYPKGLRDVAISLDQAAGRRVSRLQLADFVLEEVLERCLAAPENLDSASLRQFDERDWLRDRRCSIDSAEAAPLQGTAVGIAPDGALLFRPDRGALARITSGRVRVPELPMPDY
ncbi:MAG: biotin--[acetyl-CoA-carboxylase] ligase, partial [Gemmatimonadota bacterium]